ncbi:VOC family protein [Shewanella sp. NFH-SH190041]|uniref:VOC family protein n=1 Tax=Shewanella sp. NFH-SH190041 TaxID=2950245 RepID=UPI0021C2986C|nr:VOC family protein [Shewanella sp. NFH-SH190041]BDM64984.1 VOC family protein [Shewanella sp. NFH-SH190041]
MDYHTLMQSWADFSAQIQTMISELGLTELHCDHAALRVNDLAQAEALKQAFSQQGQLISDNQINGRSICIFKLDQPLPLGTLRVNCIELPFPSDKHYPTPGWEHIELVVPTRANMPTALNCEALLEQIKEQFPQLIPVLAGETGYKIKLSSPASEHERLANPTVALKKDGLCIKLHPHGIEAVIASERS